MPDDDVTLICRYARDHSEEAFAALVRRRIGLVYSCALRRVGYDAQLAEDVTQEVFSALARKASEVSKRASLLGWLYVSTQNASAEIVRAERRRKNREIQANGMETILHSSEPSPEIDWSRLRPLLDELIADLKDLDREALMLRFFEQRPFAEIGATLSLTEEGARKRVERAVERIRLQLAHRGVKSTTGALAFALGEQTAVAVPAALVGNVVAVTLAEIAAAGAGASAFIAFLSGLVSGPALVLATVVAGTGVVTWQLHSVAELETELARAKNPVGEIHALQVENHRLAQRIAEAADLRRDQAAAAASPAPSPTATHAEKGTTVNVRVTGRGSILWENQPVTLEDFIGRLTTLQAQSADHRPQVVVQGEPGSSFGAAGYTVEQASKAGIADIAITTSATPGPADNWMTAPHVPPGPKEIAPPSLPDPPAVP